MVYRRTDFAADEIWLAATADTAFVHAGVTFDLKLGVRDFFYLRWLRVWHLARMGVLSWPTTTSLTSSGGIWSQNLLLISRDKCILLWLLRMKTASVKLRNIQLVSVLSGVLIGTL